MELWSDGHYPDQPQAARQAAVDRYEGLFGRAAAEPEGQAVGDTQALDGALELVHRLNGGDELALLEHCVASEKQDRGQLRALLDKGALLLRDAPVCSAEASRESDPRRREVVECAARALSPRQLTQAADVLERLCAACDSNVGTEHLVGRLGVTLSTLQSGGFDPTRTPDTEVIMIETIGARFKSGGKQYYPNPNGQAAALGQEVAIETSRGLRYGECTQGNTTVENGAVVQPLHSLIRLAAEKDLDTVAKNRKKEAWALSACQEKIVARGLDMKLVEVEYNFERNKILFFFTSKRWMGFHALVRDLVGIFHVRIELRQIGVRDRTKILDGLDACNRLLYCATLPDEF